MAKTPCLDCIDKHEKTKQRKRKAKQRQKKKEQLANPAPIIRQTVLPPAQPFIPPTPFKLPSQTQNDLTFFQRSQELDTLTKLLEKKQQRLDKESDDYYNRLAKANPQFLTEQGTPRTEPKPEPTLERTRKPAPKTANEGVSQVVDNYVGLLTSGVPSSVLSQTPAALAAPAVVTGQYVGGLLKQPFQFLGNAASTITRPIGNAISSVYYSGNPDPEIRREAAASAAENRASLQRTASAVGGTTPELQFIGSTGRVLESSPVEQGANPLPSVFTASAPPVNLLADLQARRERDERLRPRTRIIPEDEIGGEGGSRLIEQQRRMANPVPLAPPSAPREYQRMLHNRAEPAPLNTIAIERTDIISTPEYQRMLHNRAVPAPLDTIAVGEPSLLIPETETADALGERTILDLALRPRVDFPLVPVAADLIPETESLAPLEDQMTPEEPLLEVPPTFETAASLATGEALEEAPLTTAGLLSRALERQTTEELASAIEDIDTEELRAETEKQEAEKRRRKEDKKEANRIEREIAKAEKSIKKEAQQYERLLGAAAEIQPSQLALVEGPSSVASSPLLIGAGLGLPPRSAEFTTYDISPLTSQEEEYEPITFTQPPALTFKFAEGGGV